MAIKSRGATRKGTKHPAPLLHKLSVSIVQGLVRIYGRLQGELDKAKTTGTPSSSPLSQKSSKLLQRGLGITDFVEGPPEAWPPDPSSTLISAWILVTLALNSGTIVFTVFQMSFGLTPL
jgi:hypothetical protein